MGEISWLSSFKTVGGIKSGPVAVVSSWPVIYGCRGRYSDVWHIGVRTGPFVRKGARHVFLS